jgi:hypothetical protein
VDDEETLKSNYGRFLDKMSGIWVCLQVAEACIQPGGGHMEHFLEII